MSRLRKAFTPKRNKQFEAALKLDRSNSWVYHNLGLLFLNNGTGNKHYNFEASLNGTLRPTWIEVWARIKRGNACDGKVNVIEPSMGTTERLFPGLPGVRPAILRFCMF